MSAMASASICRTRWITIPRWPARRRARTPTSSRWASRNRSDQQRRRRMSSHHLEDLALSDTGFVFDPYSGGTFTVNATGLAVLTALREGLSRDRIGARLRERFHVASGDPERDVDEFVDLLKRHGVVGADFTL